MKNLPEITKIIDAFKKATILCVGDLMLDLFVYGDVSRISPEAPIPILKVGHEVRTLGGVGNVVNNLLALGAKPILVSAIGQDVNGDRVLKILKEKGISADSIATDASIQTIEKRRFSTKGQQLLRVDYETIAFFQDALYKKMLSNAEKLLEKADVLIISDYGKGVFHPEKLLKPLIEKAKKRKIPIVTDPKGTDYTIYRGTTVITPNRKELSEATTMATQTDKEVISAANQLIDDCGIENVLATRSEDGMTLVKNIKEAHHYKTQAREVFDVSGAGDTVVATVAATIATGANLQDAAYLSNLAGAIVVGKLNTATVSAQELKQLCTSKALDDEDKLMTASMVMEKIKIWHQKNLKVGFTNGCFDLLHQGHMRILRQSKAACDKLVVAINSDASVKRLKGPSRPINDEKTRATIIACLQFVDAVVIFEEDTPLEIITRLQPDVLIKGADYTVDQVVGASVVQKKGGKVVLVDLVEGKSSTNIINKIQK